MTPNTLIERLRGIVRIPVNDGAGLLDGKDFFERSFPTSNLAREAADEIERLTAALGDAVVVPSPAVNYDDILSRISVWRDYQPEEDETWESWYYAAFDLFRSEVVEMQKASTVSRQDGKEGAA